MVLATVIAGVATALFVAYGVRLMHRSAAEKLEVLRSVEGSRVRVGVSEGKALIVEHEGTVASVERNRVGITRANGATESLQLGRIRWVEEGRRHLGNW